MVFPSEWVRWIHFAMLVEHLYLLSPRLVSAVWASPVNSSVDSVADNVCDRTQSTILKRTLTHTKTLNPPLCFYPKPRAFSHTYWIFEILSSDTLRGCKCREWIQILNPEVTNLPVECGISFQSLRGWGRCGGCGSSGCQQGPWCIFCGIRYKEVHRS